MQKWIKWFAVCVVSLGLTGCLDIVDVRQPTTATLNASFTVQVDVASTDVCEAGATCKGVIALSLPVGWAVESCEYAGDVSGTCSEVAGPVPSSAPTDPANSWRTFGSPDIIPAAELPSGTASTVTLRLRPTTVGTTRIDYGVTGYNDGTRDQYGQITTRALAVQSGAIPVPILSPFGKALLAFGFGLLVLVQLRKSHIS